MKNRNLGLACLHLALAIILGAFGAHKLKELLPADKLSAFNTGVQYHMYHALALLILNSAPIFQTIKSLKIINYLLNLGILFFCGSIYALSTMEVSGFTSLKALGPITPIGGLLFIVGWCLLAIKLFNSPKDKVSN